jgi:general secretion pathway protein M
MSLRKVQALRMSLQSFWVERDPRERRLLAIGSVVVLSALIYGSAIAPALQGTARLKQDLPGLRTQVALLQSMATEAQRLTANPVIAPPLSTREDVEASLTRNGLKAQNVVVTGEVVRVQLNGAAFSSVLRWLDELRKTARLNVVDSSFTAQSQADIVNAAISLRQPDTVERVR